jgi:hypothetical protein
LVGAYKDVKEEPNANELGVRGVCIGKCYPKVPIFDTTRRDKGNIGLGGPGVCVGKCYSKVPRTPAVLPARMVSTILPPQGPSAATPGPGFRSSHPAHQAPPPFQGSSSWTNTTDPDHPVHDAQWRVFRDRGQEMLRQCFDNMLSTSFAKGESKGVLKETKRETEARATMNRVVPY